MALLNPRKDCMRWIYADFQSSNDVTIIVTDPPYEVRPAANDDFDWGQTEEGDVWIDWKGGRTIRASDSSNVEFTDSAHFCDACTGALDYLAHHLKESMQHRNDEHFQSKMSVVHQWNLAGLHRSSTKLGCRLCDLVWRRCIKELHWVANPIRTELLLNSTDDKTWNGTDPGDARLIVALTPSKPTSRPAKYYDNNLRFQLWPDPDFDRFFTGWEIPDIQKLSIEPVVDSEKNTTRSARPLALRWLSECKTNADGRHDACNATSLWRPTRLLSLKLLEKTGRIFLISGPDIDLSISASQDYISLSHCWGEWGATELPTLTSSNIRERQEQGINISSLPPTFQHAVEIAGWFEVNYLWIDSLCIIQDNKADWEHEAPMMCEVYKNALLNISADDSVDARGGCFRDRGLATVEPFRMRLQNLSSSWWVTVDERNLFEWIKKSPISKRAWVYQERHLSRRVLHFTEFEVFWECCAASPSFRSEMYPTGSPLKRDFVGETKLPLLKPSAEKVESDIALSKMWDSACCGISKRALTNRSDALPSLSGLAKEVASLCPADTYIAGMWLSSLPRTILWAVEKAEKDKVERSTSMPTYVAPSWSWLSPGATIKIQRGHSHHSILDIANVEYETEGTNRLGRITKASLTVKGFIRKLTFVDDPSPFEEGSRAHALYTYLGTAEERNLYVDDDLDNRIGYGVGQYHNFGETLDCANSSKNREYHCLLVGVTKARERSDACIEGLLLEEADESACFRRIGVINMREDCALKVRYAIKRQVGVTAEDDEITEEKRDDGNAKLKDDWAKLRAATKSYWEKRDEDDHRKDPVWSTAGPMSLYDFDGDLASSTLERLRPQVIKLI